MKKIAILVLFGLLAATLAVPLEKAVPSKGKLE